MYISQGYIKKKSEFEKMETGSFEKIFIFAQYDKGGPLVWNLQLTIKICMHCLIIYGK